MANSLFDQFKATLIQALQDTDFRRKNAIFADDDFLADAVSRIQALTPDVAMRLDFNDVISTLGMIEKDNTNQQIRFEPKGFETTLSSFREGISSDPRRFWRRDNSSSTDGVRYLLADRADGVFQLNDSMEVLRRFPNFGTSIVTGDYESSNDAVTFMVGATEYIAITSYSHEVVQIYLYNAPFTNVATIGTVDTPGATSALLESPVSLAVDTTNDLLFIACEAGMPAGASAANGFITIYDISTPSAPVHEQISHFFNLTGSILDGEINEPRDIFFDNTDNLLWVSNGGTVPVLDEVGAFTIDVTTPVYTLTKYLDTQGSGYTFETQEQVWVQDLLGGFKRIYVANGTRGTLEEFDFNTLKHLASYGFRATTDSNTTDRFDPDVIFGAIGTSSAMVADRIVIDDQEVDTIITSDPMNRRIHRFNLNAYTENNFANFQLLTFDVPVTVNGWSLSGTLPLDMVKVFYRFSETDEFRELPQDTTITSSSTLQFRVSVQLDTQRFVKSWIIRNLRISATQT